MKKCLGWVEENSRRTAWLVSVPAGNESKALRLSCSNTVGEEVARLRC